jgi:hypothetical protein
MTLPVRRGEAGHDQRSLGCRSSHYFKHFWMKNDGGRYRKSNPAILMVQSAQDRTTENASGCLGGAWYRCILVQ